jgi:hypothetical protein
VPVIYIYIYIYDSAVGILTGHGLDGLGSIPAKARDFSLLHSVKTSSGDNSAPYPMGTGESFSGGKAVGA